MERDDLEVINLFNKVNLNGSYCVESTPYSGRAPPGTAELDLPEKDMRDIRNFKRMVEIEFQSLSELNNVINLSDHPLTDS